MYGTDPLVADCDDDGLVDGDEIAVGTEPLNPDTDGDGINDKEDNCPLIRGIYSLDSNDIVVGEMTIVSSTYNSIGHSFLVYKSNIFDTLDFSKFEKGYYIDTSNNTFFSTESDVYFIGNNNYVTMGASGADIEELRFTAYELFDCDTAGVFYNRYKVLSVMNMNGCYEINLRKLIGVK